MNRAELEKLANYLLALPEDYQSFDMNYFYTNKHLAWDDVKPQAIEEKEPPCGTVACAIGHGPAAGCGSPERFWSWYQYSEATFGLEAESDKWDWCFAGQWEYKDNTPHGAAKRILWLLSDGLPEDWGDQMCETDHPLCYM